MALKTFIEAIRETLADEMRHDDSVIILGEDVGKKGGVFLATDGLWAEFGEDRVIDTPLTESMIVGASIGAALNGLRPGAVRRRRPRRALPLAVRRGVLHPRAGPQGRRPVDPVRCEGPAPDRDPRRRPGPVLRAQEDVPLGPRRGAGGRLHGAARAGPGPAGWPPGQRHRVRPHGPVLARGR